MSALFNPIVLDSNIVVSAILNPASLAAQAIDIAAEHFEIVVTKETLDELLDVLQRPKFDRYLPLQDRFASLREYIELTEKHTVDLQVTDCKDPRDNKFLALALHTHAALIVTGDKRDLLSMNPYKGIAIVGLREFVDSYQSYLSINAPIPHSFQ